MAALQHEQDRLQGVKPILAALDFTVSGFARELGVHRSTVIRWANGEKRPRGQLLARLEGWLAAHQVELDDFLAPPSAEGAPVSKVTDLTQARAQRGLPPVAPAPAETTPSTTNPANPTEEDDMINLSREYLDPHELDYWGLASDPFDDVLTNPEDVFMGPAQNAVEAILVRSIPRKQIIVLVGEPGAGKSTLVRRLHGKVSRDKRVRIIAPASLDRTRITHAALSVAILRDLTGAETSSMAMERRSHLLQETLDEQSNAGAFPVLLIDEAHLLKPKALLAIKHLWDSHILFKKLAVVMVGQPPLEARLRHDPSLREVTNRARIVQLPPLGTQTGDYLRWRFGKVDGDADGVFTEGAFKAMAGRGKGLPLAINNIAVAAMRYAAQLGEEQVTAQHVGRA